MTRITVAIALEVIAREMLANSLKEGDGRDVLQRREPPALPSIKAEPELERDTKNWQKMPPGKQFRRRR